MTKVVAIKHAEVMKCLLDSPQAIAAYEEAMEEDLLLEQLTQWRENAGLTKTEIARRMGVNPPAINRLERNVTKASYHTLKRYAAACGVNMKLATDS